MKHSTKILLLLLSLAGCKSKVPATTAELIRVVTESGGMMYSMQDCLCYGKDWRVVGDEASAEATAAKGTKVLTFDEAIATGMCDVKSVCGDMPAIVGFDLGEIELGRDYNIDKVPWDFMRRAATAFAHRGGIVTFSWHARNPLTGGTAWDCTSTEAVSSILPGGANHDKFLLWLEAVADFLDSLRDGDGSLIPIIFRPWHENTGSWFWWGRDLCTEDEYKALWQMTYDYVVKKRGLEGMAWAYSPSNANLESDAMARYPGDDIIDIIGVDQYDAEHISEASPSFAKNLRASLEYLNARAEEHGLLLAVTETGQAGQTVPEWWTRTLLKATEGLPVCYVLTWRNAWDRPDSHWHGPFPGAPSEADFRAFHDSPRTIFLKQLNTDNK